MAPPPPTPAPSPSPTTTVTSTGVAVDPTTRSRRPLPTGLPRSTSTTAASSTAKAALPRKHARRRRLRPRRRLATSTRPAQAGLLGNGRPSAAAREGRSGLRTPCQSSTGSTRRGGPLSSSRSARRRTLTPKARGNPTKLDQVKRLWLKASWAIAWGCVPARRSRRWPPRSWPTRRW